MFVYPRCHQGSFCVSRIVLRHRRHLDTVSCVLERTYFSTRLQAAPQPGGVSAEIHPAHIARLPHRILTRTWYYYSEKQPKLQKVGRFGDLLKDQQLYQAFMAFLATEYAQENLGFFREVLEFESLAPSDKKEVKKRAQAICERYLGIGPANDDQKLNLPLRLISSVRSLYFSSWFEIYLLD